MGRFVLSVIAIISFSSIVFAKQAADTSIITHFPDGLAGEWPEDKFSPNAENGIETAVINDNESLHIIIRVKQKIVQTKMLQNGMRLFIDVKGKHKKNLGIEFPLKHPGGGRQNPNADQESLALMVMLNPSIILFGFGEGEPVQQQPDKEGSIRLGFAQDSAGAMNIEYLIPLAMLEKEIAQLSQKNISIGWIINGMEEMPQRFNGNSNALGGHPNNGMTKPPGSPGPEIPVYNPEMEKMMKEQEFWIRYTIAL